MEAERVFLLAPNCAGPMELPNTSPGVVVTLSSVAGVAWRTAVEDLAALLSAFLIVLIKKRAWALVAGSDAAILTCWQSSSHCLVAPVL